MNTIAHVLSFSCIVACIVFFAGCSSAAQPHHPDAYQGGQYYGDAVHPENQEARPAAQ